MSSIILLLSQYGYVLLFPFAIVEGPIVTVVAGFLTTLGVFNPLAVYMIVVFGDAFGDSFLYGVGRMGGTGLDKVSSFFRITPEKLGQAKQFFETHHHKTLLLSKVFHGIGVAGLLAAGMLRVPYMRFASVCFLISLAQSGLLLLLGVLFGHAYVQIGRYLDFFSAGVSIAVLAAGGLLLLYKVKGLSIFGK